jgi:hypothetical protein
VTVTDREPEPGATGLTFAVSVACNLNLEYGSSGPRTLEREAGKLWCSYELSVEDVEQSRS